MKKIMFNDKYGLTAAVLNGEKTMTRRIVPDNTPLGNWEYTVKKSRYQVGEVVAVAQPYYDVLEAMIERHGGYGEEQNEFYERYNNTLPWRNKMFVKASEMPHRIRITDIKVERLQDISDEDCLNEGIYKDNPRPGLHFNGYAFELCQDQYGDILASRWFKTSRDAFASLIDKVSGKGTWERNPWVFAYTFELERRAR